MPNLERSWRTLALALVVCCVGFVGSWVPGLLGHAIMVEGRRRLFFGDIDGPELAAYPPINAPERRVALSDLYESATRSDSDARILAAAGGPVYILYRPGALDSDSLQRQIESRSDRFQPAYGRGGYRVFRLEPPAGPNVGG
jgi:hypothetical protein